MKKLEPLLKLQLDERHVIQRLLARFSEIICINFGSDLEVLAEEQGLIWLARHVRLLELLVALDLEDFEREFTLSVAQVVLEKVILQSVEGQRILLEDDLLVNGNPSKLILVVDFLLGRWPREEWLDEKRRVYVSVVPDVVFGEVLGQEVRLGRDKIEPKWIPDKQVWVPQPDMSERVHQVPDVEVPTEEDNLQRVLPQVKRVLLEYLQLTR